MSRPNKIIEVGIGQVKAASASGPISALEARHAPQGLQSSLVSEQGLRSGVGRKAILRADAIGSCIAVAAYDSKKRVGAMAHVMLPGSSPDKDEGRGTNDEGRGSLLRTRYAADAIEVMINKATRLGANRDDLEVCLVGAGNVLKRNDDTICQDNIASVVQLLREKRIKIRAEALGGTNRRSVRLDVERGSVFYAEADENEKLLWKATEE